MHNFEKLNQIDVISKLLKYSITESRSELISAFEFDPITIREFVNVHLFLNEEIKDSKTIAQERMSIYLNLLEEIVKIIEIGVEIGIEFDDINPQNIIVKPNPSYQSPSSSASIHDHLSKYNCLVFYDEREKEYSNFENNHPLIRNKIYWSPEKLESQFFNAADYTTQEGEESIYQLGLMILDLCYELESTLRYQNENDERGENELKPDEAAGLSERLLSYYVINNESRTVKRNEVLFSQRLNYFINSNNDAENLMGVLLKKMIDPLISERPNTNQIMNEIKMIRECLSNEISNNNKMRESLAKSNHQNSGIRSSKSIESVQSEKEEQVNIPSTQTLKNFEQGSESSQIEPSNPLTFTSRNSSNFKKEKPIAPYQNEKKPVSSETTTSDKNSLYLESEKKYSENNNHVTGISSEEKIHSSNNLTSNGSQGGNSVNDNTFSFEELLSVCKEHHESLQNSLTRTIEEINLIKKAHPESILKKQYFDGSIYYGCIDQITKKRLGLGVYLYKAGDIYFGEWKENTLTNGFYLFKNGESFEGVVKGGKQGVGLYRYSNGNIYNGNWKDDLKNGKGVMTYPNGACYEGEWMKGKKHGEGIYYYENGIEFRGAFALGKKYGNGVFTFPGGTKVEGFWDNNHLEGMAKIYYQNGDYYEGNFHMSEKTGEGIYKWEGGQEGNIEYRGEFKKDCLDGFAIIKFRNGEVYEGKVSNGKRNGQGSYKYANGDQFKGEWKNDYKQMGKYIFKSGEEFEGRFKDGQMVFGTMFYTNGEIYQGEFERGERNGAGTYSNKLGQLVYEGLWENDQFVEG